MRRYGAHVEFTSGVAKSIVSFDADDLNFIVAKIRKVLIELSDVALVPFEIWIMDKEISGATNSTILLSNTFDIDTTSPRDYLLDKLAEFVENEVPDARQK